MTLLNLIGLLVFLGLLVASVLLIRHFRAETDSYDGLGGVGNPNDEGLSDEDVDVIELGDPRQ